MTCRVLTPIPTFMCSGKRPWHAQYLEMHLMGVQRMMFYHDLISDRYNQAVMVERIYKDMGLITYFSMN
jgi:hypothetical protein